MEHPRRGQARLPENAAYLSLAACLEASINPQMRNKRDDRLHEVERV